MRVARFRLNDAMDFSKEHKIPITTVEDLKVFATSWWAARGIDPLSLSDAHWI